MVTKVIMPKLGETMEEGEIIQWLKKEGERVKEGEPLLEIATDKANMEVEAVVSGFLKKIVAEQGKIVPVTGVIAYITEKIEEEIPSEGSKQEVKEAETPPEKGREKEEKVTEARKTEVIKSSPLARKLAKDEGIDLQEVKGTGPEGRIVKEDVLRLIEKEKKVSEKKGFTLSRVEKLIAEKMTRSKREIPHFYLTIEVDFSQVAVMRQHLREEFEEKKGLHLTYTDFLIKTCALSLALFPRVNSYYEEDQIKLASRVNIGLAITREQGLIVPVIKEADKKSLFAIGQERVNLVKKTSENSLSLKDLEGGTFTLSNLGMMGIKRFTPIINPPEVCILGVGEIKNKPVVVGDRVEIAPLMEMTLSCDHRVVDGYLGARFLEQIKKRLERPSLLLI